MTRSQYVSSDDSGDNARHHLRSAFDLYQPDVVTMPSVRPKGEQEP